MKEEKNKWRRSEIEGRPRRIPECRPPKTFFFFFEFPIVLSNWGPVGQDLRKRISFQQCKAATFDLAPASNSQCKVPQRAMPLVADPLPNFAFITFGKHILPNSFHLLPELLPELPPEATASTAFYGRPAAIDKTHRKSCRTSCPHHLTSRRVFLAEFHRWMFEQKTATATNSINRSAYKYVGGVLADADDGFFHNHFPFLNSAPLLSFNSIWKFMFN